MWSKRKEIDVKRGRLITQPAVIATRSFEQQRYELHEINDHNRLHGDENSSDISHKNKLRNYTTELTVDSNDFNFVTALDYALVMVQDARREIQSIGSWLLTREKEYVHESMFDEEKKSQLVMEALLAASEAFTQIEYFFIGTDNGQMYLWPLLPPHFISRFMHEWRCLQKSINHFTLCTANELPCVPDCSNTKRLIHRHAREEPVIAIQWLGVLVCSISTDGCVAVSRFHPIISPVTTFQQSRPLQSVCVWEGQIFTSRANTILCSASPQETSRANEREIVHPETKYENELTQKSQILYRHKSAEEEEEEQREMECKECAVSNCSNDSSSAIADDAAEVASVSNEKKNKANNLSTLEIVEKNTESISTHEMTKDTCRNQHSPMQVKQQPCNKSRIFTKSNMADRQLELWNASMHVVEQRAMYICTGDDAAVVRLWRVDVLSHHAALMHVFVCCPTLTRMHSPLEICQREDTEKLLHARETTMSVHCLCIDADKRLLAGLDNGIYVWALDRLSWHGESELTDTITHDNCTSITLTDKINGSKDHHSDTVITSQLEPLLNEKSERVLESKEEHNNTDAENFNSLCDYHVSWESNHHLCWDEEHNMPLLSSLQSCAITDDVITKQNLNDVIGDNGVDDNSMKASSETASLEKTCNLFHYSNIHEKHDCVAQKELRLLQLRASRLINHHVWLAPAKCVKTELSNYHVMNKINDSNDDPAITNMKRKAQCNSQKLQASKWKDQYAVKLTDGRAIGVVCNEVQFAHLRQDDADDDDDDNIINCSGNKTKNKQSEKKLIHETTEARLMHNIIKNNDNNCGNNNTNKVNSCEAKGNNVEHGKCNPMHYCLHNSLVTICFDDGETRKDIKLPLSCVAPVVYPLQYMPTAQTACFALLVLSDNEYVVSSGSDGAVRVWKRCKGGSKKGKSCEQEEMEEEYIPLFITSHYSALSQSNGINSVMTRGLGRMLCLLSPRGTFVSCGFDDGLVKEWHLSTEPEELLRCERRFTLLCSSSSSSSSSYALPICSNANNSTNIIDKGTAIRAISSQTQSNDDNKQTDKNNMNNETNHVNPKEMSTCARKKENEHIKCTDNNRLTSVLEHTDDEYGKLENSVSGISCIVSFPAFSALFIVGVFECVIQTFTLTEVQGCDVPANYIYNGYKTIKLPLNDLPHEYYLDETLPVEKYE